MMTQGIDTFTLFQENKLLEVAGQCPLSGGDAVFRARSLYSLVDPLVKYDDEALCAPAPEARPQQPHSPVVTDGFKLSPNPARDQITIRLHAPLKDNTLFAVYDAHGRVYLTQQLEAGGTVFYVNTDQLKAGIYYCRLGSPAAVYEPRKLIVIR